MGLIDIRQGDVVRDKKRDCQYTWYAYLFASKIESVSLGKYFDHALMHYTRKQFTIRWVVWDTLWMSMIVCMIRWIGDLKKKVRKILSYYHDHGLNNIAEDRDFEKWKLLHLGKKILPYVPACRYFRSLDKWPRT